MVDCIIAGLKAYIQACPLFNEIGGYDIDWNENTPDSCGIFPESDTGVSEPYINGNQERQYTATVQISRVTRTDAERLENNAFLERLQRWFDNQKVLPEMPEGCTPNYITADNGMLFELDENGSKGVYQLQISLDYNMKGR